MTNLLYIAYFAPYDTVDHAGGKVCNFYVKKFQKQEEYRMTLLTMCYQREMAGLDLDEYGIDHRLVVLDKTKMQGCVRKAVSAFSYFNPWDPYSGVLLNYERYRLKKMIKKYAKENERPDLIILQWTQIILLMPFIRNLYPNIPIVAIEEDVFFLNFYRKTELATTHWRKKIADFQYRNLYQKELAALNEAQMIVTNNPKDAVLLEKNSVERNRVFVSSVYFENYDKIYRNSNQRDILFYGAMYREENHMSAMWFIKKVMPLLPEEFRFVVVGSRPNKELLEQQNERIRVLGFVENIEPFFAECICLAAPLLLGAGIKVKILEAMSAGVPVLTNEIGIEGIGAEAGREYFHCQKEKEYADTIKWIAAHKEEAEKIAYRGKDYVRDNFNLEEKYRQLLEKLNDLQV